MFICSLCLKKYYDNGPTISKSYGTCEICEKGSRLCNDIYSKDLLPKNGNGPVETETAFWIVREVEPHNCYVLYFKKPNRLKRKSRDGYSWPERGCLGITETLAETLCGSPLIPGKGPMKITYTVASDPTGKEAS